MYKIKDFLFKNRTVRQTVLKNIFWQTIAQVGGRIIRAFIIVYAARVLTVEHYGVFSYAANFVALFTVIADLSIEPILTREMAKKVDDKEKILSAALYIKGFLSFITLLAILFIAPKIATIEASKLLMPFLGLSIILESLRQFCFAITKAMERMQIEAIVLISSNLVVLVLGFLSFKYFGTSLALSIAYMSGSLIGFVAIAWYLRKILKNSIRRPDIGIINRLIKDAIPISLLSITGTILMSADIAMLGWLTSEVEVGYYSAATKLIALLITIPTLLVIVLFPIFSRRVEQNESFSIAEKAIAIVNLIGIPITIGGILLADSIIRLIYGFEYLPAVTVFRILLIGIMFMYPSTVISYIILAHNAQARILKYFAIAACSNIILSYFFIMRWGGAGAAFITVSGNVIIAIGYYFTLQKIDSFRIFSYLWRPFFATCAMSIIIEVALFFNVPVIIIILLAIFTYGALLKFMRDPILRELIRFSTIRAADSI